MFVLQASERMCTDRGRFKKDASQIVRRHYGMQDNAPKDNMARAQDLLQSANFIYPVDPVEVSFLHFVKYLSDYS